MDATAIIAITIIALTFTTFIITLFKHGLEDAIKVWALLGFAFGAIVSFYFTSKVKDDISQKELSIAIAEKNIALSEREKLLASAKEKIEELKSANETAYENNVAIARYFNKNNPSALTSPVRTLIKTNKEQLTKSNAELNKIISELQHPRFIYSMSDASEEVTEATLSTEPTRSQE